MSLPVRITSTLFLALFISGCGGSHLISDKALRRAVEDDFRARAELYGERSCALFSVIADTDDPQVHEAGAFLLAYMPMSDLALLEPGYLLSMVTDALRAREQMPWGRRVPSELFLSFVLPARVNNENPDDFRSTYYEELRDRVAGLPAMEAALEINRWCQEKVAYQAADSRTSSPMATILSARGRCGEESTFTVSALRAISIPARQVYTPRWAHTDDNHAWVEFWADGAWHYLGACEPEPVPDRGWFTEPARRAMLVHTKAFGRYAGNENVIRRDRFFTELNTLDRYAMTKELRVKVTDPDGAPVTDAVASYMLYNYAEFYPLARLAVNDKGESSLMTGYGTLLIWADDGERHGYTLAMPDDTEVTVTISAATTDGIVPLDIVVPDVPVPFPGIDPLLAEENNRVILRGDSIRNSYISSWMAGLSVAGLAEETALPAAELDGVLKRSMGNWRDISGFLMHSGDKAPLAMRLLANVSDKDLRDTPADVLADHLENAPDALPGSDPSLYDKYILSPRVANELLTPFRSQLLAAIPGDLVGQFREEPAAAAAWVDSVITVSDTENHYSVPIVPGGVLKLKMADHHSREIFLVALFRTCGIPARLEPGTGRPQYHHGGAWNDVWFSDETRPSGTPGYITFVTGSTDIEPEYHVHFSLARLERGHFKTLDYGYGVRLSAIPRHIALDPGIYMLTTGNRDENGNVMATLSFIELEPEMDMKVVISPRTLPAATFTGGSVSLAERVTAADGDKIPLSSLADKGLVMIWIEPGKEPTRHILNDLPGLKGEFDKWEGRFIFLTDPSRTPAGFDPASVEGQPERSLFAVDEGLKLLTSLTGGDAAGKPLPVVICTDSRGEVLFSSEGYRIGTARQLLKKLRN